MTIESRPKIFHIPIVETGSLDIARKINNEVDRLLNIPEYKRKAVGDFLLWMVDPSLAQRVSNDHSPNDVVYSDPKLELAVDFIGSRLAGQYGLFTDVFERTISPSPFLPPRRTRAQIEELYNSGCNAEEIMEKTGLSIINVYIAVRKMKRSGLLLPRTEQFGYARINEEDLEIALARRAGLSWEDIGVRRGVSQGKLMGIANKLIELGLIDRLQRKQTKRQRAQLDNQVEQMRREGKSRRKIAELLNITDGVIQSSIRRLARNKRTPSKERRFTEAEWEALANQIRHLREEGLLWKKLEKRLGISSYRSHIVRRMLKEPS